MINLQKNLDQLGLQYSEEEIYASVKLCPGDNNSAMEKLLNNEITQNVIHGVEKKSHSAQEK